MIKAIFFDIDGTLVSHTSKSVPDSTKAALCRLKKRGVKLFVATGRHMLEMEELPVSSLTFDGYITLNGQICLDAQRNLLYDAPIISTDKDNLLSLFMQKKLPVMIVEKDRMYINFVNETVVIAQKAISTPLPETGIYTGESIYQFIVYGKSNELEILAKRLADCSMSRWNPYAADIISKTGGKVTGIRQCLQRFGIEQNETMAFGDGENDIDMLHYAGIGVAMGNAERTVKEAADYIAASVDQNGIDIALRYYGL